MLPVSQSTGFLANFRSLIPHWGRVCVCTLRHHENRIYLLLPRTRNSYNSFMIVDVRDARRCSRPELLKATRNISIKSHRCTINFDRLRLIVNIKAVALVVCSLFKIYRKVWRIQVLSKKYFVEHQVFFS